MNPSDQSKCSENEIVDIFQLDLSNDRPIPFGIQGFSDSQSSPSSKNRKKIKEEEDEDKPLLKTSENQGEQPELNKWNETFIQRRAQKDQDNVFKSHHENEEESSSIIEEISVQERRRPNRRRRNNDNISNETKNIPKNYGKQIIKFITKNKKLTKRILEDTPFTFEELEAELKKKKKEMNNIPHLRSLWVDNKYEKPIRILSQIFLKKYSLPWIFNSRMTQKRCPIKYRSKIMEGVRNPTNFLYLKEY